MTGHWYDPTSRPLTTEQLSDDEAVRALLAVRHLRNAQDMVDQLRTLGVRLVRVISPPPVTGGP